MNNKAFIFIFCCFMKVKFILTYYSNLTRDDIFIAVRTEIPAQSSRIQLILETWFQNARKQTWLFTDVTNTQYEKFTNKHMVLSVCEVETSSLDQRHCCEMEAEFIKYFEISSKDNTEKWFCRFSDSNYVNVHQLTRMLRLYNPDLTWYIGRRSEEFKETKQPPTNTSSSKEPKKKYWFADLKAGFCISRALALQLKQRLSNMKFLQLCRYKELTADSALGYLIEVQDNVPLTTLNTMHSCEFENVYQIPTQRLRRQISLCYNGVNNIVRVPGISRKMDPTRFRSLHCYLFPKKCNKKHIYTPNWTTPTHYDFATQNGDKSKGFQMRPDQKYAKRIF